MSARRGLRRFVVRGVAGVAILGAGYAAVLVAGTPDVRWLARTEPARTRFMERQAVAASLPPGAYRTRWVPLDSISPLLACAVVRAEDKDFFTHAGFEWGQVARGVRRTVGGGGAMGGSTLTQQVARNVFLGPERTPHRKLREALIARELEARLSKRRILEVYLNVIEWGDGVWGARAAGEQYFGRGAAELDAFEASFLAALVPAPRAPLRGRNAARARQVQRRVLLQLYMSYLLDEGQARAALARADTVHALLASGVPAERALRRGDPLDLPRIRRRGTPSLPARPATPPEGWAVGCGLPVGR